MTTSDDHDPILLRSRARLGRLRDDFFARLCEAMDRPLLLAEDESMEVPIACWRDARGALNCLHVLAYRQPCDAEPDRPLLPRVHVNFWFVRDRETLAARAGCSVEARPRWSSQITVLPRELGGFAGWIAALVRVVDGSQPLPIPAPPHPCHFGSPAEPVSRYVWSVAAWAKAQRHGRLPLTWGLGETPPMRAAG